MMKSYIISTFLILLLAYVVQLFLPWWSAVIVAFVVGYSLEQSSFGAFLSGFTGLFFLWAGYAFILSSANDHLLANKVTVLMQALTGGKLPMLFLITGVLGGISGGLGCLLGNLAFRLRN